MSLTQWAKNPRYAGGWVVTSPREILVWTVKETRQQSITEFLLNVEKGKGIEHSWRAWKRRGWQCQRAVIQTQGRPE